MGRYLRVGVMICLTLCLTGCWDKVEIEDKGFVIGVAVDLAKDDSIREKLLHEDPEHPQGKFRYSVTNQIVSPSRSENPKEGISGESTFNIASEGDTIYEAVRGISLRSSRPPYYEHSKMIIISEELAKQGELSNIIDVFLRSSEMKRAVKVMVSRTVDARKILNVKPVTGEMPVIYIDSITENETKASRMMPFVLLGDLHEFMLSNESFALPGITSLTDNEVKISEAGIFNGETKSLVGFLGETETQGYNFITNRLKGGILETKIKDLLVGYEIKRSRTKIKADVSDKNNICFTITIKTLGSINEKFADIDVMNQETIQSLETRLSNEIKRVVGLTLDKLQNEFKTDAIGFGDHLRQNHYRAWKKLESDWDKGKNYFSQCKIEIRASANINNRGPIIKSHEGQKMR